MNLATLVYDLRSLGVRKITLELDNVAVASPPAPAEHTPEPPPETKLPTQCKAAGCGEERAGLFGGSVGGDYCRAHAAQRMGART